MKTNRLVLSSLFAVLLASGSCSSGQGTSSGQGGASAAASGGGARASAGSSAAGGSASGGASNSSASGGAPLGGASSSDGGSSSGGSALGGSRSGGAGGAATGGAGGARTGGTKAEGGQTTGSSAMGGSGGKASTGASGGTAAGGTSAGTGGDVYSKPATPPSDEDGSQLWLRYPKVSLAGRLAEYQAALNHVVKAGSSATLQAAQSELVKGLSGLTGTTVATVDAPTGDGAVIIGTPDSSALVKSLAPSGLASVGSEGYVVVAAEVSGKKAIVVAGNSDVGVLRGTFALLRHLQCHKTVAGLSLKEQPRIKRRILNHWDNMDGSIERGYAGTSIWNWNSLPGTISQKYKDYARANASLGINGVVLNNVNANAQILSATNLTKVAALADTFRTYGITVYLTARFSAPIEIGGQSTADPNNSSVKSWWADKVTEIYGKIPDFGGFLVKANSEGQPGPADYNRTHADGAKMLSDAIGDKGGIVLWRAFVYKDDGSDRIKQAYAEFKPLDGKFGANTLIQVKNGPLDFQPREPFSPLFGAMTSTPVALELQITKEYLGMDTHLAYLGPLYEEVLKADTYAKGEGSTVAKVIDGSLLNYTNTAISGVANVGSDVNWTGSHFNQANWYVYGRMAWNPDASAKDIADEWIRQTFSNDPAFVAPVTTIMMDSRQNVVNYMEPLGLVHIMNTDHHYGPGPWVSNLSQANWNPTYFHKADGTGIGFDRTSAGSNAVSQYASTLGSRFAGKDTVGDDYLLFFHHVGWDDKIKSSGRTVWEELVHRYSLGVDAVQTMRNSWKTLDGYIDGKRFKEVTDFLQTQHYEARWWRDACLQYFASVSKKSIPGGYAAPAHDLAWYKTTAGKCPSNATKPRCPDVYTGNPSPAITP